MDALSSTRAHAHARAHGGGGLFRSDAPFIYTSVSNHHPRRRVSVHVKKISHAHQVLDEIPMSATDTFAWNNLIHTHLASGDPRGALSAYHHMMCRGVSPDPRTFPRLFTASRLSTDLRLGKQLHAQSLKLGFSSNRYILSTLIDMYGRLDGIGAAKWLFDKSLSPSACSSTSNSVSWTTLAGLYLTENKPHLALDLFFQMLRFNSQVDPVALTTAFRACGLLKSVQQGRKVHGIARRCSLESDILVCNSLLKMYIDCNTISDARATFDQMPVRDVISFTEIIRGYVKKGGFNEALKLFRQMNVDGIKPDAISISSVLPACARTAAHKHGKEIHGCLLRNGIDLHLVVQNALMDMYVKSGFLDSASKIFARMKNRDVISWTVMMLGCSLHGQGELGVQYFRRMEKEQISTDIDRFAYAAVLHSCMTACMVEEGKYYFNCIKEPNVTDYALMVGLFARAALFDQAGAFIEQHNIRRHGEVLRALLDGCRIHRQAKIGKQVIQELCNLEHLNAENYVLLSNWYIDNAQGDMDNKWRVIIGDVDGLEHKKAYSWIESHNKVHAFGTGDVSHPMLESIYSKLQCLMKKMETEALRSASAYILHDVDEERECIQIGHSEMLALSFGLISTQAGATIRITKNLLMCRGCHDFAKRISKIEEREIIIKDPRGFHHFRHGNCSCGDIW